MRTRRGLSDLSWQVHAECRTEDPELFFGAGANTPAQQLAEALSVCGRCAVTAKCLAYALENDEKSGVWGGKTEGQRRRLAADAGSRPPAPSDTTKDDHDG